jgi:hypothetical protein
VATENGFYDNQERKHEVLEIYRDHGSRVPHIQQILYIYTSHLASRLKRPNPLAAVSILDLKEEIDAATSKMLADQGSEWQPVLNGWLDLVELGQAASQVLYKRPQSTTKASNEGNSVILVRHFTQALSQWWKNFETLSSTSSLSLQYLPLLG